MPPVERSINTSLSAPAGSTVGRRAGPLERGQFVLLALLAVLTAGAWAITIHQARTMDMAMGVVARGAANASGMDDMAGMAVAGMAGDGWSLDGFATFVVVWAVMMAAMMFPAAAPMILLFRMAYSRRKAEGRAFVPTWMFSTGYLLVWTAVGVATYALVHVASDLAGRLDVGGRETWAPLALGAVLIVAGLYQLTPLKRVCLDHCRSPLGFVMTHWREGRIGALRMGIVHGGYCLGCCWALFAVLVAAGVMSLAWMALLTLVVFAEKVLPLGRRAPTVVGTLLVALGVLVAIGAADLPWMA